MFAREVQVNLTIKLICQWQEGVYEALLSDARQFGSSGSCSSSKIKKKFV